MKLPNLGCMFFPIVIIVLIIVIGYFIIQPIQWPKSFTECMEARAEIAVMESGDLDKVEANCKEEFGITDIAVDNSSNI